MAIHSDLPKCHDIGNAVAAAAAELVATYLGWRNSNERRTLMRLIVELGGSISVSPNDLVAILSAALIWWAFTVKPMSVAPAGV